MLISRYGRSIILTVIFWIVASCQGSPGTTVRRFELNITSSVMNPDCHTVPYQALLVNNQFPGPVLRVVKGDHVEVLVRNQLDPLYSAPTSIHFHGIRQYGTVESDGVPDVTQQAIPPGESFLYRFQVTEQSGTYFYHAHVGMQDDTVQGPFIVHDNPDSWPSESEEGRLKDGPFQYDEERILQLSEWWHQPHLDREAYYMGPHFVFDKGADSILMNGRTIHHNQLNSTICSGYTGIRVQPNKTYRLRVIGANTFRTLGLAIANHTMTIIEVDGQLTKPYETDWLEVGPGQRFSVLIRTQPECGGVFPIATSYRWRHRSQHMYTENGFGYLVYEDDKGSSQEVEIYKPVLTGVDDKAKEELCRQVEDYTLEDELPLFPKENRPNWIWPKLSPLAPQPMDAILDRLEADRTIVLRSKSVKDPATNMTRYWMNGVPPPPLMHGNGRARPMLHDMMASSVSASSYADKYYTLNHQSFPIAFGEVVDLVFQNVQTGRQCLIHPWHTHGHSHYQIASGPGEYQHELHKHIRNFPNPLYRDVSMVYPSEPDPNSPDKMGCGWTKVRLYAVSPDRTGSMIAATNS